MSRRLRLPRGLDLPTPLVLVGTVGGAVPTLTADTMEMALRAADSRHPPLLVPFNYANKNSAVVEKAGKGTSMSADSKNQIFLA